MPPLQFPEELRDDMPSWSIVRSKEGIEESSNTCSTSRGGGFFAPARIGVSSFETGDMLNRSPSLSTPLLKSLSS